MIFTKITLTEACCTFIKYSMIDINTGAPFDPSELQLVDETPSST